jgi:Flp pilus assembly protein TadD
LREAASEQDVDALASLSSALLDAGRADEALQVAYRAVHLDVASPAALAALGYALLEVGEFDRALEAFERAISIEPHNLELLAGLAVALGANGQHSAAALRFDQIATIDAEYVQQDPRLVEWATRSRKAIRP